ncbi:hypothetical protein [uncultured Psychrobacter sp.]|uniref:hypothetical protein n=1 Tax=uncultured Psychrobacter sp. TaxID=259303 RepID=UPI0030D83B90
MSSYSFSHQFYQRWTCAPEPIRASIIQELTDITTLLKAETPFETFVFSTHDLDAHLDDLYENHEAEQAIAKAIADKQAAEQLIFEQQRLEEEQKIKAAETKRQEEAHLTKESRLKEQALEEKNTHKEAERETLFADDKNRLETAIKLETADADETEIGDKVDTIINDESDNEKHIVSSKTISEHANATDDDSIKNDSTIKNDSSINAINNKASLAISLAVKDAKLSVTHKDLIHELEMQIDDYLSDQMMLMSENLKSWLRAEMTQHLSEQDKTLSNGNPPKN